jgi:CRP-like cAMP-binding protein
MCVCVCVYMCDCVFGIGELVGTPRPVSATLKAGSVFGEDALISSSGLVSSYSVEVVSESATVLEMSGGLLNEVRTQGESEEGPFCFVLLCCTFVCFVLFRCSLLLCFCSMVSASRLFLSLSFSLFLSLSLSCRYSFRFQHWLRRPFSAWSVCSWIGSV